MENTLSISPGRVFRALTSVVALLALASLAGQASRIVTGHDRLYGFVPLFDLNAERNVPTWFSSGILLLSAVLLLVISSHWTVLARPYARHWRAMALIFCALSIDELAGLHEMVTRDLRGSLHTSSFLYYAWVIPGAAFVIGFALAYLRFLLHLPRTTRWLFIVAGAIYAGSAIGVEMLEGAWDSAYGHAGWAYVAMNTVEEVGEMMGIVLFIYALLEYMREHMSAVRLSLRSAAPAAGSMMPAPVPISMLRNKRRRISSESSRGTT